MDDHIWYKYSPGRADGFWERGVFVRWSEDKKYAIVSDGVNPNCDKSERWHHGHLMNRSLEQISLTPPEGYKVYVGGRFLNDRAYKIVEDE
jgi:hypothetical protein